MKFTHVVPQSTVNLPAFRDQAGVEAVSIERKVVALFYI